MLLALLYCLLLIPSPHPATPANRSTGMTNFVWNQDKLWRSLEEQMIVARQLPPAKLRSEADVLFTSIETFLSTLEQKQQSPDASIFREVENSLFRLAAVVSAQPQMVDRYAMLLFRVRAAVKEQSWRGRWDMNSFAVRSCLYRLLFGARTAVDEVIVQHAHPLAQKLEIPAAPAAGRSAQLRLADGTVMDIRSGDLLLSRGDAPTSAFIARGNDFPGNFSHVALAHVDAASGELLIIESLIHHGLVVTSASEYASNKLRLAVLRLRPDHPKLVESPGLSHRSAAALLQRARTKRVPYDFAMNWGDPAKLFCSEVASAAYAAQDVNLWMGMSHISSPGLKRWLAGFGVEHFETQEPSDLEYDPQLLLVAEWRGDLRKDRADNAAIDAMLEAAEKGAQLDFPLWKLPLARVAKGASVIANLFHFHGKVPAGMDASAALRQMTLTQRHELLVARLRDRAEKFKAERGYVPPYWELLRLARESNTMD